jgi:hypothetical protein
MFPQYINERGIFDVLFRLVRMVTVQRNCVSISGGPCSDKCSCLFCHNIMPVPMCHAMKGFRGHGCKAPYWIEMSSHDTPWLLYPQEKSLLNMLNRKLSGSQNPESF